MSYGILKTKNFAIYFKFVHPVYQSQGATTELLTPLYMTCPFGVFNKPAKFHLRSLKIVRMHWDRDIDREFYIYIERLYTL